MHTVFRICEIKQIDNNNSLYRVELQLTSGDDSHLRKLTEYIRQEVNYYSRWQRLGRLLIKIGQVNKAEELYNVLLERTSEEGAEADHYAHLGCVKNHQGEYEKAMCYHAKGLEIFKKTLRPIHSSFASSYINIAATYYNKGEYSKALSFYERAIETFEESLPPDHFDLVTSYNNIGEVYRNMGEYSKALLFGGKALKIIEKTLLPNHSLLATTYNNSATIYYSMGQYSKALSYYERALDI